MQQYGNNPYQIVNACHLIPENNLQISFVT
jgi:hypothetical protein